DPQPNLIAPDIHHGDDDVIPDDDAFVAVSGQDQHLRLLPPANETRNLPWSRCPGSRLPRRGQGMRRDYDGVVRVVSALLACMLASKPGLRAGQAVARSGVGPGSRVGAETGLSSGNFTA